MKIFASALIGGLCAAQSADTKAKYPDWSMATGIYRYSWEPIEVVNEGYTLTMMRLTGTYILDEFGEPLENSVEESNLGWGRPDLGPLLI
jgi:pimeloyl-ACP methyl ester carboxylesterase